MAHINYCATLSGAQGLAGQARTQRAGFLTSNLDRHTAHAVEDLILGLNTEYGVSLLLVTHDPDLAGRMQKVMRLEDGLLRGD